MSIVKQNIQATLVAITTAAVISGCSTTESELTKHEPKNLSLYYQYQLPQNDIYSAHGLRRSLQSGEVLVKNDSKILTQTTTISAMEDAVKCSKTFIEGEEANTDCFHTLVYPRLSIDKVKQSDGLWVVEGVFSNEMGRKLTVKSLDGNTIVHTQSLPSGIPLWTEGTTVQRFTVTSEDKQPVVIIGTTNNKIVLSLKPLSKANQ